MKLTVLVPLSAQRHKIQNSVLFAVSDRKILMPLVRLVF